MNISKYVSEYIEYSIMNSCNSYNGNYKVANYAANEIKRIEMEVLEKRCAEQFIDEVIRCAQEECVLTWICAFSIKINYNKKKIVNMLKGLCKSQNPKISFEAKMVIRNMQLSKK